MKTNRTGNRCATLAASALFLSLAAQGVAQNAVPAQAASTPVTNQSTYVAPLNAKNGAPAQPAGGTPAAATTPGQAPAQVQAAAKPVHAGGRPPVVIGPGGQSVLRVSHTRVRMPGEKAEVSVNRPASHGIRVGLSRTGGAGIAASSLVPTTTVVATISVGGIAGQAQAAEAGSAGFHTSTRDSATLASAPAPTPAEAQAGIIAHALAGSSVTASKPGKGTAMTALAGDASKRIVGMGALMAGRTATASVGE